MWQLRYSKDVIEKDIPLLDNAVKQRIKKSIESKLTTDPMRFGKPLRHSLNNMRSLRIGDYRVLYAINHEDSIISIAAIGHRRDIYLR